jgi:glutathione S-transferase
MLTLYAAEWCPWCHRVREVLTELELSYVMMPAPVRRGARDEVRRVSGQEEIPVLVDGEKVVVDSSVIIDYLRATYSEPADAGEHRAVAAFRLVRVVATNVEDTIDALIEQLAERDIDILARYDGGELSARLPDDYVLLHGVMRAAAAKAVEIDATIPLATTFPIAVFAGAEGTVIAVSKPSSTVWLSEDPELLPLAMIVNERITQAIAALPAPRP